MQADDVQVLRDEVVRVLRLARSSERALAGSPLELQAVLVVEALEHARRHLTHVCEVASGRHGLWGGRRRE